MINPFSKNGETRKPTGLKNGETGLPGKSKFIIVAWCQETWRWKRLVLMVLMIIQHWRPCHVFETNGGNPSRKSLRTLWNLPGKKPGSRWLCTAEIETWMLKPWWLENDHCFLHLLLVGSTVQPIWTNNNYITWSSSSIFGRKTKTQLQPSPPEQMQIWVVDSLLSCLWSRCCTIRSGVPTSYVTSHHESSFVHSNKYA